MAAVAIIIPHVDDTVRLARCLAALMPQLGGDGETGTEVVVVDNGPEGGSTNELAALATTFSGVRFIHEPARGAAHARNRGVAETKAPLLLFLDCDCVPAPDWLASARVAAEKGDLIGGRIDVFDETPGPRNGAQAFEAVFAFDNRGYVMRKGFSVTANLVTRRDIFVATGPFVQGLSEDLDWCHRATAKGYRLVYDDSVRVAHPSRGDWAALAGKWRRLTREGFAVNGQTPWPRIVWAARALAMPLSALVHAPRILTHPALRSHPERARALAVLVRLRFCRMGWMLRQSITGH